MCVCVGGSVVKGVIQFMYIHCYMHNGNRHESSKPTPALVAPINNCAAANQRALLSEMRCSQVVPYLTTPVTTPVPTPTPILITVTCDSENMKDNQANV